MLVIGITALLLLLWDAPTTGQDEGAPVANPAAAETGAADTVAAPADSLGFGEAADVAMSQAKRTLRGLAVGLYGFLPKLAIALVVLLLGGLFARGAAALLRRAARSWDRGKGAAALGTVAIWIVTLGATLSILAGDARALVGSVGLMGLALSWALQTPIESFTGWLLNSFKGYYHVGDRIAVGDVFGDVYRIDVLTTTVWEAGGPGKAVQAAQPTGALITFPNYEVLRSNVVNYTRDFPYVWDEVTVGVTNESDLNLALEVARRTAGALLGEAMRGPILAYRQLLDARGLAHEVGSGPQVYLSQADSWMNVTVRYLVGARERRHQATELVRALARDFALPEYQGRLSAAYPRLELLQPERGTGDA
ncbi:MAG: mechanosensitive ion channel [Candidatus Krumholzibacteriia bacterium]